MALTKLNAGSFGGGSPTVWRADRVMLQVQGWCTENLGIEVPPGEEVVALPALLAVDAVAALDGDSLHFIDLMRMLRVFATSAPPAGDQAVLHRCRRGCHGQRVVRVWAPPGRC